MEDPQVQELSPAAQPWLDGERQRQRGPLPARPNGTARHAKRLTLNFPINIPPELVNSPRLGRDSPTSKQPVPSEPQSPNMPSPYRASPSPATLSEPPDEGYGFLTALAAQERKVLELKEELQRAESELTALKRQWEQNERGRKITQVVHRAEAMKPLRQSPIEGDSAEGSTTAQSPADSETSSAFSRMKASRDFERRHGSRHSVSHSAGTHQSSRPRTVFQNSRHTRTLSLLASAKTDLSPSSSSTRPCGYPRSATLPSVERESHGSKQAVLSPVTQKAALQDKGIWRRSLPPIPQDVTTEAIVRTGKQIATDFKDGLWTFIDDIRQATVGDEGINATRSRTSQASPQINQAVNKPRSGNSGSRNSSAAPSQNGRSTSSKSTSTAKQKASGTTSDTDFWAEFGVTTPIRLQSNKSESHSHKNDKPKTQNYQQNLLDVDDNWDVWDSPKPKTHTPSSSSSTFPSKRDQSPSTNASSPRTSASGMDFGETEIETVNSPEHPDGIPWPAIVKTTPSKLTRTASTLMAEWERSLSPARSDSATKGSKDD